jgi:hypothetical protein
MRLVVPAALQPRTVGISLEGFLARVPPLGWQGGDAKAGQVVTEGPQLVVVVDRVLAFPTGVDIAVAFHTIDTDVISRIRGLPTRPEMRERAEATLADLREHTGAFFAPLSTSEAWLPRRNSGAGPTIGVSLGQGSSLPLHSLYEGASVAPDELAVFERSNQAPIGALVHLWLRPLPSAQVELEVTVGWRKMELREGSMRLEMGAIWEAAASSRQLYDVEWEAVG